MLFEVVVKCIDVVNMNHLINLNQSFHVVLTVKYSDFVAMILCLYIKSN